LKNELDGFAYVQLPKIVRALGVIYEFEELEARLDSLSLRCFSSSTRSGFGPAACDLCEGLRRFGVKKDE